MNDILAALVIFPLIFILWVVAGAGAYMVFGAVRENWKWRQYEKARERYLKGDER